SDASVSPRRIDSRSGGVGSGGPRGGGPPAGGASSRACGGFPGVRPRGLRAASTTRGFRLGGPSRGGPTPGPPAAGGSPGDCPYSDLCYGAGDSSVRPAHHSPPTVDRRVLRLTLPLAAQGSRAQPAGDLGKE